MYPKIASVTLKEFFVFVSCLLSAAPAGYGGKKLWRPSAVQGVFVPPNLSKIMKMSRFDRIKSCFAAAFACDENTNVKDGESWCCIDGYTPANDPWAAVQGLVNDFNKNRRTIFSASNRKILDESMSSFRPQQTKQGNLPNITYLPRKPKPLGTELKDIACAVTGVMLFLDIARGKVCLSCYHYI